MTDQRSVKATKHITLFPVPPGTFVPKERIGGGDRDKIETFQTHFNGARTYLVELSQSNGVRVYGRKLESYAKKLEFDRLLYQYENIEGFWPGAFDNVGRMAGYNILVKLDEDYLFISDVIQILHFADPVLEFRAPMGRSDIPYAFAFTKSNIFTLANSDKVGVEHNKLTKLEIPEMGTEFTNIAVWWDIYGQTWHPKKKTTKVKLVSEIDSFEKTEKAWLKRCSADSEPDDVDAVAPAAFFEERFMLPSIKALVALLQKKPTLTELLDLDPTKCYIKVTLPTRNKRRIRKLDDSEEDDKCLIISATQEGSFAASDKTTNEILFVNMKSLQNLLNDIHLVHPLALRSVKINGVSLESHQINCWHRLLVESICQVANIRSAYFDEHYCSKLHILYVGDQIPVLPSSINAMIQTIKTTKWRRV